MSLLESIDFEAGLYRLLRFNCAVTRHELRQRMRGVRAYWVLFAYAAVASGVFLLALWLIAWEGAQQTGPGLRQTNLGRTILQVIAHTQLALVLLIVPAYSAGAIAMEREKRTLEMLRATLLTPADVVTGKLLVALVTAVALLISSLPIAAWCLMLGGVAPEEMLLVYGYLLCVAIFAASLGMLFSSRMGRSLGAVVVTYGAILTLVVSPVVVMPILFALTASAQSGRFAATLGPGLGWTLTTTAACLAGWLAFLTLRWVWRRLLGRRLPRVGGAVAVLAGLALLVFLLDAAGAASANISWFWVLVLEPFVALAAVLSGADVMHAMGSGTALGIPAGVDPQHFVWAICCGLALAGAVVCWALATRTYRVRQ